MSATVERGIIGNFIDECESKRILPNDDLIEQSKELAD